MGTDGTHTDLLVDDVDPAEAVGGGGRKCTSQPVGGTHSSEEPGGRLGGCSPASLPAPPPCLASLCSLFPPKGQHASWQGNAPTSGMRLADPSRPSVGCLGRAGSGCGTTPAPSREAVLADPPPAPLGLPSQLCAAAQGQAQGRTCRSRSRSGTACRACGPSRGGCRGTAPPGSLQGNPRGSGVTWGWGWAKEAGQAQSGIKQPRGKRPLAVALPAPPPPRTHTRKSCQPAVARGLGLHPPGNQQRLSPPRRRAARPYPGVPAPWVPSRERLESKYAEGEAGAEPISALGKGASAVPLGQSSRGHNRKPPPTVGSTPGALRSGLPRVPPPRRKNSPGVGAGMTSCWFCCWD